MKTFLLALSLGVSLAYSGCQHKPAANNLKIGETIIQFVDQSHDFGKMTEGEKKVFDFQFVNAGNFPLRIQSAQASCGCTVPKFTDSPIKPGEKGNLTVEFNSEGKENAFEKSITVTANTNPPTTNLTIKGFVIKKK